MNLRTALELYVIPDTDAGRGRSLLDQTAAALAGGATAIQLRDKKADARALYETAVAMKELCQRHRALFIVNDRVDVALAAGADGVHLGPRDLPVATVRALAPEGFVVGASARTSQAARTAEAAGADYLGVGAMRATGTKSDAVEIGPEGLATIRAATRLPLVAIGGIRHEDLEEIVKQGADGVAVISAIVNAPDIESETQRFKATIRALRK